jgi:general secretion pathway protein G
MQATLERLRRRHEEGEGGFTLIELLIVIVILAILAAIVVFAVQNLTKQSATAACSSDFKTVESAAETYKAQVGVYPGDALPSGFTTPTVGTAPTGSADNVPLTTLMGTVVDNGTVIGPWLKDYPYNSGHYQLELSDTAPFGVISVWTAGTATATQIPSATTATYTSADCTGVS